MLKQKQVKPRQKICRFEGCCQVFTTSRQIQPYCGPRCEDAARRQRRKAKSHIPAVREVVLSPKSQGDHVQELQVVFNAFIRERDYDEPCPTCGTKNPTPLFGILWDAGHYLSVGAHPELRFNEDNCHKQCRCCNSGVNSLRPSDQTVSQRYRMDLERRIGPERLALLEGPHDPKHYQSEELIALKKHYRARTREMKRAREKQVQIT